MRHFYLPWIRNHIINFISAYGDMADVVDDLVDEPFCMERFRKFCVLKSAVYSSNYWMAHRQELYLVDQLRVRIGSFIDPTFDSA